MQNGGIRPPPCADRMAGMCQGRLLTGATGPIYPLDSVVFSLPCTCCCFLPCKRLASCDFAVSLSPRARPLFICASGTACKKCMADMSIAALLNLGSVGIFQLSLRRRPYPPPSAGCYATPGMRCILLPQRGPNGRWRILLPRLCHHFRFRLRPKSQAPLLEWSLFFGIAPARNSPQPMHAAHGCRSALAFATGPVRDDYPGHSSGSSRRFRVGPRASGKTAGPAHPLGQGLFVSGPFFRPANPAATRHVLPVFPASPQRRPAAL